MSTDSSQTSASLKPTSEERLRLAFRRGYTPPPRISIPDWADRYRRLAREAGSSSGRWRTKTVEIARGPMLAVTEPGVHTITAQVSTQLLKTSLLENVFGYHAHLDPCPMLLVQPKEEAAEQFSKERIKPLIKATPALRLLIRSAGTRDADDTILYKAFPGGFLAMVGAGSPDNLARRPVRIVLYDEVDKYPPLVEGDPLDIGDERTATFPANWLSIRVCSPTIEDESRINASYKASDQRRASVECPHCQHRQFLEFGHIRWDKAADGSHRPRTAQVFCEACGTGWAEGERLKALDSIRWHQMRPFTCCDEAQAPFDEYERAWKASVVGPVARVWDWWESARFAVYRAKCRTCGLWAVENDHAGFQASKLYSPWTAKDGPAALARKFLDAQGDAGRLQVFTNTQLAETFKPHTGRDLKTEVLLARREVWPGDVPAGAGVITVGIDLQHLRVEIETVAWGADEESWSIDYDVIDGEFSDPATQAKVDEYLGRTWIRADGRKYTVEATCIDSGGTHTQAAYAYSRARLGRNVWAIKGASERNGQRQPIWPASRSASKAATFKPVIIGTSAAKDIIRDRLVKEAAGPGFMHFPDDRDAAYFEQLLAERIKVKTIGGQRFRVWEKIAGRANEALDCRVYAIAALTGLQQRGLKLNQRVAAWASVAPDDAPKAVARRVVRSGYMGRR